MLSLKLLHCNLRRTLHWRGLSSSIVVKPSTSKPPANESESKKSQLGSSPQGNSTNGNISNVPSKSREVQEIFAKLRSKQFDAENETTSTKKENVVKDAHIISRISKAKSAEELLLVADETSVNRYHALKVVSTLAEWNSANKIKLQEFENNPRFLKLCRLLGRNVPNKTVTDLDLNAGAQSKDVEMILNVAGEEETAKVISSLQLSQMVRVLSSLTIQKKRSTPILRSLAYNISSSSEELNLKECSDVLYSMNILNFHDNLLATRVGVDIKNGLNKNKNKPAVIGSIITSLGYLKYKDTDLLNGLTEWIIEHKELCRPKDLVSLFISLAAVNYQTYFVDELKTKLLPTILKSEYSACEWLDYVWSLCVLELFEISHLESILRPTFIEELVAERGCSFSPTIKKKLLNINAVAKLIAKDYKGPFIQSEGTVHNILFNYNKDKETLVNGLLDTLKNLFAEQSYVRTMFNTQMGFPIDAECVLNKKRHPLSVEDEHKDGIRIAFMVLDFQDLCKGTINTPNGISSLAIKLLEKKGYKVVVVPHTEFNTTEKILKRVQYIDAKLKDIVNRST